MTFLIAVVLLVACVWGAVLAGRGSLTLGCAAYLVLASCAGAYLARLDVGPITMTLDRLFLLALVAAAAARWSVGRMELQPANRVDWALAALVGVVTASTFLHDWRAEAGAVPIVQHLINGYFIPLAIYAIARQSNFTERHQTWLLGGMTAFGLYLAATGVFESLGWWSLVAPRYIADPELGLHYGRARGPMLHSVTYGFYLTACLFALWMLLQRARGAWRPLLWSLVPLFLAAVFLTKTRTVWLGAASGGLILLWATLRGRARALVLGGMVTAGLLVGMTKMDAIVGLQREGTAQDTVKSTSMRGSFAYVSWLMFQDRPLFGFGFGQFARAKLPYLSDRSSGLHLESIRDYVHHNTFLSVLTETGVVGLSLLLLVLCLWALTAWRLASNRQLPDWARQHGWLLLAILASVGWQMLGHEITFTPLEQSLCFLMAAVAVRLRYAAAAAPTLPMAVVDRRRPIGARA